MEATQVLKCLSEDQSKEYIVGTLGGDEWHVSLWKESAKDNKVLDQKRSAKGSSRIKEDYHIIIRPGAN